jgi:RNA polymerase sigma-70 factor (ECF subfamily)
MRRHLLSSSLHSAVEMPVRLPLEAAQPHTGAARFDVVSIHNRYAEFVWLTLQRLGVRDPDVEDLLQEVFVVVHRRLDSFDGSAKMTTWLFGICMRLAAAYHRRAFRRRERTVAQVPERPGPDDENPESAAVARQAQERLHAALDLLDLEKRAIFVMFEIDEVPCEAIAEMLSVPIGTVYSRLHTARQAFARALARVQAGGALGRIQSVGGQR